MPGTAKSEKGRDKNFEFTTLFLSIPLSLALATYLYVSLSFDGHSCYVIDSNAYHYWLPNLAVDKEKLVSVFGNMQTCQYFSAITACGLPMVFWLVWKIIHQCRRSFFSIEAKLAKIFWITCLGSFIFLNLDFVDY